MKTRINAFWQKHFAADLFTPDGSNVAIEESHVEGLEAMGAELETLRADNATLKGENQTHAESITALETAAEASAAVVSTITGALEAANVELAEGADVAAIAVEKINAWAATVPPTTPIVPTGADNFGDDKPAAHMSEIDKRAQEKFDRQNKTKK
jgi:hypothetical protein